MGVWDLVCIELGGVLGSIFMTILNRQHPKNGAMLGVFRGGPRNLTMWWNTCCNYVYLRFDNG